MSKHWRENILILCQIIHKMAHNGPLNFVAMILPARGEGGANPQPMSSCKRKWSCRSEVQLSKSSIFPGFPYKCQWQQLMRGNESRPDSSVNVRQCICGCAWWWPSEDVSLEQLSSLCTGAMSTCRRTLRLNMDVLPLRRYSARNDVWDTTLWLRSGIWQHHHPHHHHHIHVIIVS